MGVVCFLFFKGDRMAIKGIEKIKIPIRATELTIEAVEPYLETIFREFSANAEKIRKDYNIYRLNSSILSKTRKNGDTDVNNIVAIPNIRSAIEWKLGYTIGNPIKYAQIKETETNDIEILNKHFRGKKPNVNSKEHAWAYATGVGYTFIEPKSTIDELNKEAPFNIYHIESDKCAKVYSAYLGEEQLFDIIYTEYQEIDSKKQKQTIKVMQLYFPKFLYTYEKGNRYIEWTRTNTETRGLYQKLPLTEKRFNADGIGIVATAQDMTDTMDLLISSGLDNVQEIVNEFFIYYNVELGEDETEMATTHKNARKNGAINLNSASKDFPAKVETITPKLSLTEVRELYGVVNEAFHELIGYPFGMSNTNSGGTTKSGSEVANGWDNAYTRALQETNFATEADYEQLEKIMWIEKNTPNSQIELDTYDILIKYIFDMTDNILTKSQAFGTFINYMHPTDALRLTKLSGDPEAEGMKIANSEIYKAFLASKQPNIMGESLNIKPQRSGEQTQTKAEKP